MTKDVQMHISLPLLGLPEGPASADMLRAAEAIIAAWNRQLPINHVRFLNLDRFAAIRQALGMFGLERVLQAIEYYSRQSWQRSRRAWKRFDAFMSPPTLRQWIEEAMEAVEKRPGPREPADPRLRPLAAGALNKQGASDRWDQLRRQFTGLPADRQTELLVRAAEELRELTGCLPTRPAVQKQALVVLARSQRQTAPT